MEVLLRATIPVAPQLHQFSKSKRKPSKHRLLCCLGNSTENNGLSSGPLNVELENHGVGLNQDELQPTDDASDKTQSDIWKLFKEAQRNILYLNRQRLQAMEELDELKRKHKSLLDKIEQMEVKSHVFNEEDLFSTSSELLLRIDSMVLAGIINTREASELRSLVTDPKVSVADYFSNIIPKSDAEILGELRQFANKRKMRGFHIIHICSEMEPVASVGSLGSYVTSLSHALQRKGNFVEVILPKYASLKLDKVKALREVEAEFYSYFNGQLHRNRIWTGVVNGIGVTFIEPIHYHSFFSTERIYGYPDDFERIGTENGHGQSRCSLVELYSRYNFLFTYFSRASLDYILKSGKQPDVLHIHNWETSIVGPLFWDIFADQGLDSTRILLTCQSFTSQCVEHPYKLALCGLDPAKLHRPDRLQDNSNTHLINVLKGGVVYSNKVIVMSSLHSKSQIIHSLSHGLESTLGIHEKKLLVAPFGFDNSTWDPSRDKFLPRRYSSDDMRGKSVSKFALQQRLDLPADPSSILVGCIFSEVSDVDLDDIKTHAWSAARRGVQFIFIGSNKLSGVNRQLESLKEDFKDMNVKFLNEYEEALSHLIFAGSDIILCSFSNPTLEVALKAMKYGAAPVAMTVTDNRLSHFMDHDSETKLSQYIINTFGNVSLSQALDEIKNRPSQWNRKMMDAMAKDLSWDAECCDIHVSAYTSLKELV